MCTTIVVGKNRSATGSVMMAHSEELGRNSAHKVEIVPKQRHGDQEIFPLYSGKGLPEANQTARYISTRIFEKCHYPGDHTSGVNIHGVMVANNLALLKEISETAGYAIHPDGVIWTEFSQLVLERATTAREGVELIGRLCQERGLSCDSATMLAVCDYDEAWWVELARDGQWVAKRVQPDEVIMRANCYRIGLVDFEDKVNFLHSASLLDYARGRGWYVDGPFNFAEIYGEPDWQKADYNLNRHHMLEQQFNQESTVDAQMLMGYLREVYEHSPLYKEGHRGSPFRTGVRTIARLNTEASVIIELQRNLPPEIGIRMWCNMATSLSGVYVPFHLGSVAVERHYAFAGREYSKKSAYWRFVELSRLLDYGYNDCAEIIKNCWRDYEADARRRLPEQENRLGRTKVKKLGRRLAIIDRKYAKNALRKLKRLLPIIKTKVFYEDF